MNTFWISIIFSFSNPEAPPAVIFDPQPSMSACIEFDRAVDEDEEIKKIEERGNLKSISFCTDKFEPLNGAEDTDSSPEKPYNLS